MTAVLAKHTEQALLNSRILVVDDTKTAVILLTTILEHAGYKNLYTARDGLEALDAIKEHKPDLLILDIMMPNMNGFEVAEIVRRESDHMDLPILVQTAAESSERIKSFEVGASDVLTKPIDAIELLARVKLQLQLKHMREDQRISHERMSEELYAAQKMQTTLIPSAEEQEALSDKVNMTLRAHYESSSELSGDLWGAFALPEENKLALYSLDFTGHGVVAALNTFRMHAMILDLSALWQDPQALMAELNNRLKAILPVGQYCTMVWMIIDPDAGQLEYCAAGAPPIFLTRTGTDDSGQKSVDVLETDGLPVGVLKNTTYPLRSAKLSQGDKLFLYSDALIESEDINGHCFTEEQLMQWLSALATEEPASIISTLLEMFAQGRTRPLNDDLTLISLAV